MAEANITRLVPQTTAMVRHGYCHQCDRQVPIRGNDQEELKCTVCEGGFVELLDEATTTTTTTTNTSQQTNRPAQNIFLPGQQQQFINPFPFLFRTQQPVSTQRVEFILPGAEQQLDFYGMLNNLIGGLLGPAAMRQGGPHVHMFEVHGNLGDYAWGPSGLDAIITQLLNQLETSGPAPASEAQINGLPNEVITNDHLEKSDQCAICMEEYKLTDKAKKLPCKHYFHEACISEWLKLHGTCPVCRKTLSGEDTSQREYVRPAANDQNVNNNNSNQTTASTATTESSTNQSTSQNNSNNSNTARNNRNNPNSGLYDEMDFD